MKSSTRIARAELQRRKQHKLAAKVGEPTVSLELPVPFTLAEATKFKRNVDKFLKEFKKAVWESGMDPRDAELFFEQRIGDTLSFAVSEE